MNSISNREKQFREGLISKEDYVGWMKDNHSNLTIGDWSRISDYEEVLEEKNDLESTLATMSGEIAELERVREMERSMALSAEQRNAAQANSISGLIEERDSLERMAKINDVSMANENDWVVIHTTVNYTPRLTLVSPDEFDDYFSLDNGWEVEDRVLIKEMKSGEHRYLDMGNAISVVRL